MALTVWLPCEEKKDHNSPARKRTRDLLIKLQVLYQLSYQGIHAPLTSTRRSQSSGSKFKNMLSKSTKANMQHFYCLIWLPWSPLRWNGKMFANLAVLGLVFGLQVENCIKYNNLLFNLLFLFMDGICRPNQSSDMVKYMFHQITEFILNNLYCQRKMILDGSRKTMNFIVLPCNIKSP